MHLSDEDRIHAELALIATHFRAQAMARARKWPAPIPTLAGWGATEASVTLLRLAPPVRPASR